MVSEATVEVSGPLDRYVLYGTTGTQGSFERAAGIPWGNPREFLVRFCAPKPELPLNLKLALTPRRSIEFLVPLARRGGD